MDGKNDQPRGTSLFRRFANGAALAVMLACGVLVGVPPVSEPVEAAAATSKLTPVTPCRLLDTRNESPGKMSNDETFLLDVAGKCGVPVSATAVSMTVTAVQAYGAGYLTVWPANTARPIVSTLNWTSYSDTITNSAVMPLSSSGDVNLYTSSGAHLTVSVNGYFSPASTSKDGRFVPLPVSRLVDTRDTGRPSAGAVVNVPRPSQVPSDAVAVAVNVTTAQSSGRGYFTLWGPGARPNTATLNTDAANQVRAGSTITPLTSTGFKVFTSAGDHVIIDIAGYFTGSSASSSSTGMFVATQPTRLLDTRSNGPMLYPKGTREADPSTVVGTSAASIVANFTIAQPTGRGFVSAIPARSLAAGVTPSVSALNTDSYSRTVANMGIVPVSSDGLSLYSSAGTHIIVDVTGYFTGAPSLSLGFATLNPTPSDPLARPTSANAGAACANGIEAADLNAYFANERATVYGVDYQRAYQLGDGRILWLFQDAFIRTSGGGLTLEHNVGLIQSGRCFSLLRAGSAASPDSWILWNLTSNQSRWFWPMGGELSPDGSKLQVFMVEMEERGGSYLANATPVRTWLVDIRVSDLAVTGYRQAPNSGADLYGWSVTSDRTHSYMYAHCYRQFGFGPLGFDSCTSDVRVARVPVGRLDLPPEYWNGTGWTSNSAAAAPVFNGFNTGRGVNPLQVMWDGQTFQGIVKTDDWFGQQIDFFTAPSAVGPWTHQGSVPDGVKCSRSVCNTYFASWVPYRNADGSLIYGIGHNRWDGAISTVYRPTFHAR